MKEKLNKVMKLLVQKAKEFGVPMNFVYATIVFLFTNFGVFIIAWVHKWLCGSNPDLAIYIEYLKVLTSAQNLALLGYCCKSLINKNNNDVPDIYEEDEDKKGETTNE